MGTTQRKEQRKMKLEKEIIRLTKLHQKPRKIGGRISVLDRLHLKQAEIARRSGKSVPQIAAQEMERRRK